MADDDTPDDGPARCEAITAKGSQCLKRALPNGDRCAHHMFVVPGRPSKLTPVITQQVVEAVLEGNYRETAAQMIGVSKRTLYNWIARGEEHVDSDRVPPSEALYVDFLHALKSAEAYAESLLLRHASSGGFGWQAPMTVLERKYPDRWGRRDTHKVEHSGSVKHDLQSMPVSELEALASGLAAKRSAA